MYYVYDIIHLPKIKYNENWLKQVFAPVETK